MAFFNFFTFKQKLSFYVLVVMCRAMNVAAVLNWKIAEFLFFSHELYPPKAEKGTPPYSNIEIVNNSYPTDGINIVSIAKISLRICDWSLFEKVSVADSKFFKVARSYFENERVARRYGGINVRGTRDILFFFAWKGRKLRDLA